MISHIKVTSALYKWISLLHWVFVEYIKMGNIKTERHQLALNLTGKNVIAEAKIYLKWEGAAEREQKCHFWGLCAGKITCKV